MYEQKWQNKKFLWCIYNDGLYLPDQEACEVYDRDRPQMMTEV